MALPESNSKESQGGRKTTDQDDKDFDPTPEALIDEIDDERTLEEEEALDGNNVNAVQEELDDLKKESEMSIEELLAYYERLRRENPQGENEEDVDDEEEEEDDEDDDEGDDEDEDEHVDDGSEMKKKKKDGSEHDHAEPMSKKPGETSVFKESENTIGNKVDFLPESTSQQPVDNDHKQSLTSASINLDTGSTVATSLMKIPAPCLNQDCETDQQQHEQSILKADDEADYSPNKHKHSMTDFIIDDEAGGMFKTLLGYDLDDSDDMDEDYSCTDDENGDDERDWRRAIHIGPDFQAEVPEGLSEYDDLPPYENEDKLVWRCNPEITQDRLLEFLKQASALSKRNDISVSPASVPKISSDSMRLYRERMQDITSSTGSHATEYNNENIISEHHAPLDSLHDVYMSQSRKRARIDYELEQENAMDGINQTTTGPTQQSKPATTKDENSDSASQDVRPEVSTEDYFQDEEQLLYLLLQCNYNFDEAIRRRKLDPFKYYLYEPMSLWSQDECLGFEHGLRTFGKNFRLIRESKVQTRTHAELVAFYYLWKKSERHDVYTNQYKLDRKRCLSHPGTTDYMDKFIEDNESATMNASSSTTPTTPTETFKPKLKEYLVKSDDTTQKIPSLLKPHPMLERNLEESNDNKVELEPTLNLSEEVVEFDDGADNQ